MTASPAASPPSPEAYSRGQSRYADSGCDKRKVGGMAQIDPTEQGFQVEADLIAEGFGLTPDEVALRMRDGRMTSRCEKGEGEDEGRWRLTFYSEGRTLRLTLGPDLQVISRASFAAPRRSG